MDINTLLNTDIQHKKKINKRAGRAIGVALLSCALMLIIQLFLAWITPPYDNEVYGIIADIAMYVISIIIPFGFAKIIYVLFFEKDKDFVVKRATPKKPALYIFGAVGAGYVLNLTVNLILGWLIQNDDTSVMDVPETPLGILLTYFMVAFLPAILEEWAFRGVLLKHLRPYGRKGAIIISSFLFGLMHVDIARVIFATAFGLILAICYDYTGSIKVTMIIHFINNAISVTAMIASERFPLLTLLLSLAIYAFMGVGIAAIIYYSITGLARKRVSLLKPEKYGYKLTVPAFIRRSVLNLAVIPLLGIYIFYIILLYFS